MLKERLRVAYELRGFEQKHFLLDVGCASGYFAEAIKNKNNFVIGADVSLNILKLAQKKCDATVCCDATHLPFQDGCFDYVSCLETLEHVNHDDWAISEINRVMVPRGIFVVSVPCWKTLANIFDPAFWLTHQHIRRYPLEVFQSLLAKFQILKLFRGGGLMFQLQFIIATLSERFRLPNFIVDVMRDISDRKFVCSNGCTIFVKAQKN